MSTPLPIAASLKQAQPSQPSKSDAGPGDILRQARESRQLSIEQVASQLKMSARMVQNLEKNDYSHINSLIFLKGYIRNYAKLVGVNSDDLIATVNTNQFEVHREHLPTLDYQVKLFTRDQFMRWMTMGLGIILVGVVLIWWHSHVQGKKAMPLLPTVNSSTASPAQTTEPGDDLQATTPIYEDSDIESSGTVDEAPPPPSAAASSAAAQPAPAQPDPALQQQPESFSRQLKPDHETH